MKCKQSFCIYFPVVFLHNFVLFHEQPVCFLKRSPTCWVEVVSVLLFYSLMIHNETLLIMSNRLKSDFFSSF